MNADSLIQIASRNGAQYAWLRQSLNDFEMAKILLASNKWDGVCYHAQQAVEKLLKFMLSDSGQAFRHTHSVHELAKDCNIVLETSVFDDDVIDSYKELSQYNTIARYPSSCDAPDRNSMCRCRRMFQQAVRHTSRRGRRSSLR